jgi:hypothetical protein
MGVWACWPALCKLRKVEPYVEDIFFTEEEVNIVILKYSNLGINYLFFGVFTYILIFLSSPCQRQRELLPSLGVCHLSSINFSHFNLLL